MASDINVHYNLNYEGERCMFYARVLTGDYIDCERTQRFQVPPVKDASKGTSYNSVVDSISFPSKFAVFYNDQSYPDYLITYYYT